MGRNKKIETKKLIEYLFEYINSNCGGNPNRVMESKFSRYVSEKEQKEIGRKCLSRDEEFRQKLANLKKEYNTQTIKACAYIPWDIDALLLKHGISSSDLKNDLQEREKYFQELYMLISKNVEEQNEISNLIKQINTLKNTTKRLKEQSIKAKETNKELKDTLTDKTEQIQRLINYIKDTVIPECCDEFLVKERLITKENSIIDRKRFNKKIIDGTTNINFESSSPDQKITDIMSKLGELKENI